MKIITTKTKVYSYEELSEEAKETARDWYTSCTFDFEWWDFIYEDAARIGLLITSFETGRSQKITGEVLSKTKEMAYRIFAEHGSSCETHKLAVNYLIARHKQPTKHEELGAEFEDNIKQEYLHMLEKELDHMYTREYAEEGLTGNVYEFTEDGKIFTS